MAVITGALVTGDSVKSGLMKLVETRLGNVDLSVSAGDRFLTDSLARKISVELGIPSAGVLQLKGSVSAGGGTTRLPKVKIFGVEAAFSRVLGPGTFDLPMNENEAVISDNLAARLGVTTGDEILIRINKPGPVPIDAPFVSDAENIVSARFTVLAIAGKEQHGRFLLQNTQVAPFNVFISKEYLQKLSGLPGLTNLILLSGDGKISSVQVEKSMFNNRSIRDAGLHLDKHATTGEWILRTPRVFFDLPTLAAIESVPADKTFWFSYFVNEFRIGSRTTPYSFVSTLPGNQIAPGEILVNRWLADDLSAKPGDSVELSYFMVGPLRNLSVEKAQFRITGIISMDDPRCDRVLMPEIPGLSDAGIAAIGRPASLLIWKKSEIRMKNIGSNTREHLKLSLIQCRLPECGRTVLENSLRYASLPQPISLLLNMEFLIICGHRIRESWLACRQMRGFQQPLQGLTSVDFSLG